MTNENGFMIVVYGSWGSEPYSFADTLEQAKAVAKTASAKDRRNEYCVEVDPGALDNPLYFRGEQIQGQ